MSQLKLENLLGLLPIEPVLPEPGRARTQAAEAESFGDHLSRVQSHSEKTSPAADPDFDRLSRPHADSADAAGQVPAESGPAGYADAGDSPGSADRDGNTAQRTSPEGPSGNERTDDTDAKTDAEDRQSSETAEAGSQTGQTQAADNDPQAAESEAENPHKVAGELLAEEVNNEESAAAKASDQASAAEDADSETEPLANQVATQGDPLLQEAPEENAAGGADDAENHTETSDGAAQQGIDVNGGQTIEQTAELIQVSAEAIATEGRNRTDQQGDGEGEGEMHRQQQSSPTRVSHTGTPLNAASKGEEKHSAGQQKGHHAQKHVANNPASAAALNSQADFRAVANQSTTSADEQTISAADQNTNAAESIAKPAGNAGPDSRLNASVRMASSREARAESMDAQHKAGETARADGTRFVRRVARAFRAIGKRGGSIRLRLSPPELGSLRLEIAVRNGLMTARVEAETLAARNLLLDHLPALRERLAQQDIRIKQFDVNLMGQSSGGLPDETANHAQSDHGSGGNDAPQRPREVDQEAKVVSRAGAASRPDEGTQLNVII